MIVTRSRKRKAAESSSSPSTEISLRGLIHIVENGFAPVWTTEHAALRLVSKELRIAVNDISDHEFRDIADLLHRRNRFDEPYCHCCDKVADTVDGRGEELCKICYDAWERRTPYLCKCESRHDQFLRSLDPRLDPDLPDCAFWRLPARERAKRLLRFHRLCVSNFLTTFSSDDLTVVDSSGDASFAGILAELQEFNLDVLNFLGNVLIIGWANREISWSYYGVTWSHCREIFLKGQEACWYKCLDSQWETVHDMIANLLGAHETDQGDRKIVTPPCNLTRSQLEFLPEVIRRCVENSRDGEAEELLGPAIASSIDMFQPARMTLLKYRDSLFIDWMPCFGGGSEDFEPLRSFDGYNPRSMYPSKVYRRHSNRIPGTSLDPSREGGLPARDPGVKKPDLGTAFLYCWKRN